MIKFFTHTAATPLTAQTKPIPDLRSRRNYFCRDQSHCTAELIALSINNWNENRKVNKQRISFLQNIKEDLILDTLNFYSVSNFLEMNTDSKDRLLARSNFYGVPIDSLILLISARTVTQSVNTKTPDKIKSIGYTEITDNESLSKLLDEYYITRLSTLNEHIQWDLEQS